VGNSESNRRTRLAPRKDRGHGRVLPPKIHSWLIRTTRVHAHLCYIVRSFATSADDGGDSVEARAARCDRTLLWDCWTHGINELEQLRSEVSAEMESPPTESRPGTAEKVAVLERRASVQGWLFVTGDAKL
jgi:hypothetical protein